MQVESQTNDRVIAELNRMLRVLVGAEAAEELPVATWDRDLVLADLSSQSLEGWHLPSLLKAAARLAADTLGAETCGVFKLEDSGKTLRLVAGVGWERRGGNSSGSKVDSSDGEAHRQAPSIVLENLRPENGSMASALPREMAIASGLTVPMAAGGYVFGVMSVLSRRRREFSESDVRFLKTVANILSIATLRRQAVVALRQAHRALFETKQYLSNVMETSSDAIVSTNIEGLLIHCNKGCENLLGYRREELVGQPVSLLFESEDEAEALALLMREGGGSVNSVEATLKDKDGRPIPVLTSASIFFDEKGQETGSVRFNRDLRDRERWREELHKVNEEISKTQNALEQAQAEADAAGELRRVNEELNRYIEYLKKAQEQLVRAEKMAALGRLTAGVSHEILNPLNVINLNLHMMLNDMDAPPDVIQAARVLDMQAKRIARIVEGLVDYSSGREPMRRRLEVNELVERTVYLMVHDLVQKDIILVQGLASGLPPILADYDQLQQVVLNLLTNARYAMPEGGQLTVGTSLSEHEGRQWVELLVRDTGSGIAPEHMDKLFDPFFTTKPEGEGAGMGLSICQGIVEAHGGSIEVQSAEGQGATFIVKLPVEPAEKKVPA